MPYYENLDEFMARMGNPPYVRTKGRVLFANGAQSDGHNHAEPPADEMARLRLRAEYVTFKLRQEEKDFTDFKNKCRDAAALANRYANPLPGPPENAADMLRAGAARIEALRSELSQITERLGETPEARYQRQLAEMDAEKKAALQRQAAEIESIEV